MLCMLNSSFSFVFMIFKKKQNALYITYKNIHYVRINRKFIYDNLIVKRPLMYKKG